MRTSAIAVLCFVFSIPCCWGQEKPNEPAKGSISGTVLRADINQPLVDVEVILRPEDNSTPSATAITDSKGSYTFANLPAGYYGIVARRPRFVMASPQLQADGYRVQLAEGQQLADVDFKLLPGGVITGRVLDEEGEPLVNSTIKLLVPRYKPAGAPLEAVQSAQANDLGEYRLFGIAPGRYYLVAHPPGTAREEQAFSQQSREARPTTYRRMYYGSALLERDARPLKIAAGTETSADFRLPKVRTATVHLALAIPKKFSNPDGYLGIVPVDSAMLESLDYHDINAGDASCTFKGVMPGRYLIGGIVEQRSEQETEAFGVGAQEIDVSEGFNEIQVPVTSFSSMAKGHIKFDREEHPPVDLLNVQIIPMRDELTILDEKNGGTEKVDETGAFKIPLRTTVRVAINIQTHAAGFEDYYLKSVRSGGIETLTTGILPSTRIGNLELLVASDGGTLTGRVLDDDGKPVGGSTVVALPDAEHRRTYTCTEFHKTDRAGRFALRGICPGHYTLLALPADAPDQIFWDTEFVRQYQQLGLPMDIAPKSRQSVDLHPIRLSDD